MPSGSRPKRLLVYINPYGGKRKAKRIYELKVAPLFARAGIRTHVIGSFCPNHFPFLFVYLFFSCMLAALINSVVVVAIVTEYANHARDHLKTEAELKTFDG